jgi:REP element-mobilizing transposase RayT
MTASINIPKRYTGSNTSVHFMNYHFVWYPEYRRKDPANEYGREVITLETMPGHVNLFIKTDPAVAPII